jgi:hypothetical protein
MKTLRYMIVLAALLAFGIGCNSSTPGDSSVSGTAGAADDSSSEESIKSGDAKVVNSPSEIQPGGAYRIEPADPNDPKYQPDPRLGGGG